MKFTKGIMLKNLGTTVCRPKLVFTNKLQGGILNNLGLLVAVRFSTLKLLPIPIFDRKCLEVAIIIV